VKKNMSSPVCTYTSAFELPGIRRHGANRSMAPLRESVCIKSRGVFEIGPAWSSSLMSYDFGSLAFHSLFGLCPLGFESDKSGFCP
jgi:hypothetical protein